MRSVLRSVAVARRLALLGILASGLGAAEASPRREWIGAEEVRITCTGPSAAGPPGRTLCAAILAETRRGAPLPVDPDPGAPATNRAVLLVAHMEPAPPALPPRATGSKPEPEAAASAGPAGISLRIDSYSPLDPDERRSAPSRAPSLVIATGIAPLPPREAAALARALDHVLPWRGAPPAPRERPPSLPETQERSS